VHSYPLNFKTEATPADDDLTVLDAEKNEFLYRPKLTEAIKAGKEVCILFTDKESRQPLYKTRVNEVNGAINFRIMTTGDVVLGELLFEKDYAWKVMDESGNQIASIEEKSAWKNSCLGQLLTLPLDGSDENFYMKSLFPHRYIVTMNGKKVMELREKVSLINDDYSLKRKGDFSEREETLLLISLVSALGLKE
jgi:hypothetical protein